jgi:hypothetical protein
MMMMSAAAGPKREFVQLMEHRKRKKDKERQSSREMCVVEQEFVRCLVYIDKLNIERDSRREEKRRARKGAERVVRG